MGASQCLFILHMTALFWSQSFQLNFTVHGFMCFHLYAENRQKKNKILHGVIMNMTVSIKTKVFLSFCIGIMLFDCSDAI